MAAFTDPVTRHDLHYDIPGQNWADGLPLGNGDLAALAYAPYYPEWLVNKTDVWDYREPAFAKRHTMDEVRALLASGKNVRDLHEPAPDLSDYPQPKSCGMLRLRCGHDPLFAPPYRITQHLNLEQATLEEALDRHLSHPRITSFVCADQNVLVIQARDISAHVYPLTFIDLWRERDSLVGEPAPGAADDRIWLDLTMPDGFRYVMMVKTVAHGRYQYTEWCRKHFRKGFKLPGKKPVTAKIEGHLASAQAWGDFDVFITVVTSREAANPLARATEIVEQAAASGVSRLHRRHAAWWKRFWEQSAISFSDPFLEGWWYASLYAGASCHRQTPAPGLCGLWYGPKGQGSQRLPWSGYYTHDYNIQMTAAPWAMTGHPELLQPFVETLYAALPLVKAEAKKRYGIDGAIYPLGSGPNCRDISSDLYRHCEQACGPFWGAIFATWDAVLQDRRLLRDRLYPVVREIARFFVNYMTFDADRDGYRLWPTQPAEYFYLDKANPAMTLTLIKRTVTFALDAAGRLRTDPALQQRWRHLLDHFPEYPADRGVWVIAEGLPREHYVWSTVAWALWPAGEIRPESPADLRRLANQSLNYYFPRRGRSWAERHGAHQGSFGSTVMQALGELRMGNPVEAWRLFIEDGIRLYWKSNGLIAHNPSLWCPSAESESNLNRAPDIKLSDGAEWMPLIEPGSGHLGECTENRRHREFSCPVSEGNSGCVLFLGEMLLQSWGDRLEIFPGFGPGAAGFDAAFDRLWAEGGFTVSARREKGAVKFVRVRSRAGCPLRLLNPWFGREVQARNRNGRATTCSGKVLELTTRRGDDWLFWPTGTPPPSSAFAAFTAAPGPRAVRFADGNTVWYGKPDELRYFHPAPPEAPCWPIRGPARTRKESFTAPDCLNN